MAITTVSREQALEALYDINALLVGIDSIAGKLPQDDNQNGIQRLVAFAEEKLSMALEHVDSAEEASHV
jgi:hypothetical protein